MTTTMSSSTSELPEERTCEKCHRLTRGLHFCNLCGHPRGVNTGAAHSAETAPQAFVDALPGSSDAAQLPQVSPFAPAALDLAHSFYLVGAHGGAGVTTLSHALGARDGGRWSSQAPTGLNRVLVARTHATGVQSMRHILSGHAASFSLLLLVPDAPGRLPKPLRDETHILSGVRPTLRVPWVETWRIGDLTTPSAPASKFLHSFRNHLQKAAPSC